MHVAILAVAGKPPGWLAEAELNYLKRLPKSWKTGVHLVAPSKLGGDAGQRQADEWQRLVRKAPDGARVVRLDERGQTLDSRELAKRLAAILADGRNLSLMLGGAHGFGERARAEAPESWSLSALTMPHELARLVLVEQLYRAHTLMEGHPYHRD